MSDESSDDKTEDPTGKKLDKAREDGNIAQSAEAKIMASMIVALIIVGMMAPSISSRFLILLQPFIERPHAMSLDIGAMMRLLTELAIGSAKIMAVPFSLVVVLALVVSVAQTKGFMWVPKKIVPDFTKLNPLTGVKRLFSVNQLMELAKALIKLSVIGALLFWIISRHLGELQNLATIELLALLAYIHDQVYWLIFATLLVVATLAVGDYLFQHWRWMEKMKMSKQEVKDEHKQSEGDPQVKARIRSIRIQRARKRMMAAVPNADVIVTNPTHFAVALKYDTETMNAPTLVAKGADLMAKRIRDLATEHDVPIVENPPLARALFAAVELDQEVPPEHYKTVAEVIGYVMRLKGQRAH
ncbi:MAG: flagellar biosynthesis protein FlhB [Rhodospirillaceae bacterium]|nr:flagellar biosynthesis protein FlhB [Rhodospirillales bacterium]